MSNLVGSIPSHRLAWVRYAASEYAVASAQAVPCDCDLTRELFSRGIRDGRRATKAARAGATIRPERCLPKKAPGGPRHAGRTRTTRFLLRYTFITNLARQAVNAPGAHAHALAGHSNIDLPRRPLGWAARRMNVPVQVAISDLTSDMRKPPGRRDLRVTAALARGGGSRNLPSALFSRRRSCATGPNRRPL